MKLCGFPPCGNHVAHTWTGIPRGSPGQPPGQDSSASIGTTTPRHRPPVPDEQTRLRNGAAQRGMNIVRSAFSQTHCFIDLKWALARSYSGRNQLGCRFARFEHPQPLAYVMAKQRDRNTAEGCWVAVEPPQRSLQQQNSSQ